MQSIRILLLGSGSLVGCDVACSLMESPWPLVLHTADADPWAVGLAAHDHAHLLPRVDDHDYEQRLLGLCHAHGIEGILVTSNAERDYLSFHRDRLQRETGARIFVSPFETVQVMSDKWTSHCWLKVHGYPTVPTMPVPAPEEDVQEFLALTGFPVTAKVRFGMGSGGVRRIDDIDALRRTLKPLAEPHILQTYMPGRDVSVELIRSRDGQIISSIAMIRKHRYGSAWHARIGRFDVERSFCEGVASALDVYGPCNLQMRWHAEQPVLFDINVRWSGSTRVRVLSGLNEVARFVVWELRGLDLPPREPRPRDIGRT